METNFDVFKITSKVLWIMIGLLVVLLFCYGSAYIFVSVGIENGSNREVMNDAFSISGSLGDSINGIFAPIIGLTAVITTFLAFVVQYQANQQIRRDTKIERIENKFYEMLRLHKENVNEIIFQEREGRSAFVQFFKELRNIYGTYKSYVDEIGIEREFENEEEKQEFILKVAYNHMFYGVDIDTEKPNNYLGKEFRESEDILCKNLPHILSKNQQLEIGYTNFKIDRAPINYQYENNGQLYNKEYQSKKQPYAGHAAKLGHYYRHLFQMIKFIVKNKDLSWHEKYEYLKMLRGQLSNHEQALIFYNAVWLPKESWWNVENKGNEPYRYLLDYGIIKNVTFNVTDQVGPEIVKYFKRKLGEDEQYLHSENRDCTINEKLQWLFEWDISERVKAN